MTQSEKILRAIHASIDELNQNLATSARIEKDADAPLFDNGGLDSVDFVSFVLLIEENVGQALHQKIDIMGESLLLDSDNPFSTISALVQFIEKNFIAETA